MTKEKLCRYLDPAAYKQDKTLWLQLVVNIACLVFICFAVYVCLYSVLTEKSLWNDEASLAYSLINRSVGELTSRVFDYEQSAPVIYLYIVKMLTLLFGTSETTLRLFSFISYLATLGAAYYLASAVLKMKLPIIPLAFISTLSIMIWFSSEFKPYMTDSAVVLSTIIVYYLYSEQKLKAHWVILIYALSVWFSNPACFFVGSILLYEFVDGICKKDALRIRFSVICGIIVLISFAIYFFYWLQPVSESGYMINFWKDHKFPLIPTSYDDIFQFKRLLKGFSYHFGSFHILILICVFAVFFVNLIFFKNKYLHVIYGGIIISLFASMVGKYPFMDRLFLFLYPLITLLLFYLIDKLHSKNLIYSIVAVVISFTLIASINNLRDNVRNENIYRPQLETNFAIDYIKQNIEEGENVYVYYFCRTPFLYKNNYDSISFGKYKNNVLLGPDFEFMKEPIDNEIERICKNAPLYLLASYPYKKDELRMLFDKLRAQGDMKLVHDKYDTKVYYYTVK